ncbi:MAG: protoporphyrinogen oxidase [Candidatus Aenigmatarchaeota archaeon]|nr:MAG: protoporphyrinogen oxidase [Candidatus Aenigmarchaeota archaeon]
MPKSFFLGLELEIPEGVYEPREDSLLLAEGMEIPEGSDVLDMGTGSGAIALVAGRRAKRVMGADINPEAIETAKKNAVLNRIQNVEFIVSDLFENVIGKFDVILFNPPYLPADRSDAYLKERDALIGGLTGREVIERFAAVAGAHLKESGKIYLIISSLTGPEEVIKIFKRNGFSVRIRRKEKIPWEELLLLEIGKDS